MCRRSGRVWYAPGLEQGFEKWDALINNLHAGRCTPILGPGLLDHLLGSAREIAQRWAASHNVEFRSDSLQDLAQVAQYLLVHQDFNFPRDELASHLCLELQRRYGRGILAEAGPVNGGHARLDRLLSQVGAQRRAEKRLEPHQVLARLPCPIYITTNGDDLLRQALQEAGKKPLADLCPWTEELEEYCVSDPDLQPTPEAPLVYHLFGRFKYPDSLVLTEDDYFDYLIGTATNRELIPETVRRAKTDSALLLLGFQIEDWRFRALLRSLTSHLMNQGRQRRKRYAHVAVQIDPQESHIVEPEMARRYLERYFQQSDISIYLGSTESFLEELHKRWQARYHEDFLAKISHAK